MASGNLVSSTGVESTINFDRRDLSESERIKAASKWFSIFIGLAVASVFVPILHFVLVPGFAFTAFFVGSQIYSQKTVLRNVNGSCPNCQAQMKIEQVRIKKVSGEICPQCRDFLKIRIESK